MSFLKPLVNTLFIFSVFLCSTFCYSQDDFKYEQLVLSSEHLKKGDEFYYNDEFENAIKEYNKVNENDTNYAAAITEKAVSYYELEQYDEVVKLCTDALENNYPDRHLYYINLGAAYTQLEDYEKGIATYNQGLEEFPYNVMLHKNRIKAYYNSGDVNTAAALLSDRLESNYTNPSYHLRAGLYASSEGEVTKAMISYAFYLILNPGQNMSFSVISTMNQLSDAKPEKDEVGFRISKKGDDFSEIDLLIENKVALNKKYKIPAKTDLGLVKTMHLIMTQIDYDAEDEGFYMHYYVPILKKIIEEEKFDMFAYYMMASSRNGDHQKLVKKNLDDLKEFRTWFIDQLDEMHRTQEVTIDGEKQNLDVWFGDNWNIGGYGKENSEGKPEGYFVFYSNAGAKSSEGKFNASGEREGDWKSYYANGKLKEVEPYKAGKSDGLVVGYHENGNLNYEIVFKEGKANGLAKYYDNNGAMYKELNFKDSEYDGLGTSYYTIGKKKLELNYKEGELEGAYVRYYAHGQIEEKGQFKEGYRNGTFESYYKSGQLEGKYHYNEEGLLDGDYEKYHFNGQLMKKGKYVEGSEVGEWMHYNYNGNKSKRYIFDESGKLNGKIEHYDIDGNLYSVEEYKKGVLVAYMAYNRKSELIQESIIKGKDLHYVGYSIDGVKISEGHFVDNERHGQWKFYYDNGALKAVENYENGVLDGEYISYYITGKVKKRYNYSDGDVNSNYISYFDNGQVEEEGWYHNDDLAGEWKYYYPNGELNEVKYFSDGVRVGKLQQYYISGKLAEIRTQDEGTWTGLTQFDTTGQVINKQTMKNGSGVCNFTFITGKERSELNYVHGMAHGSFKWKYPNGKYSAEGEYFNNDRHGKWTWYYANGKKSSEGEYFYGQRVGDWVEYYESGSIKEKYSYQNGELEGDYVYYFENGKKERTDIYTQGTRHGKTTFYVETGEVDHFRFYYEGKIVAYSYYGKDGKEIEPINIVGQTAEVITYFKNGKVSRKYKIVNGLFEGEYKKYYSNGSIKEEVLYKDDELTGERIAYYPSGKVKSKRNFNYGRKEGKQTEYYENGKVKEESFYIAGICHGKRTRYTSSGAVKAVDTFYDGLIVKMQ